MKKVLKNILATIGFIAELIAFFFIFAAADGWASKAFFPGCHETVSYDPYARSEMFMWGVGVLGAFALVVFNRWVLGKIMRGKSQRSIWIWTIVITGVVVLITFSLATIDLIDQGGVGCRPRI